MPNASVTGRRLPIGADLLPTSGVHFRVWAPRRRRVAVVLEAGPGAPATVELQPEEGGYFAGHAPTAAVGTRYRYRLDDDQTAYPDPASRFQPDGPHGPSVVINPTTFRWTDGDWPGVRLEGQVLYEMHVGAFTPEGTWAAALRELPFLAELGVTVVEVMPVAEFPGQFGWGYDGVNLFAPTRLYGTPDDFRAFVDRAHALKLGVILDVVYNHLGPDGNYLGQFAADYFTDRYETDWGAAINYDGENAGPVREFFCANAGYWIDEFHLDGLRLDATQNIYDNSILPSPSASGGEGPGVRGVTETPSPPPLSPETEERGEENASLHPEGRGEQEGVHILAAIAESARRAAGSRSIILIAENESQEVQLVRPRDQGGYGLDGLWNDDFHHSAMVALTSHNEAYYTDYWGTPQEFISAIKYGYLYQGQWYDWQKKRRGTPGFGVRPAAFVTFIQNHDQVANSGHGLRCQMLTSPGRYRALTALMLLGPGTPMLFQGQEFASSSPFFFFADHNPELAKLVRKGRAAFLAQFPSLAQPDVQASLPDPADPALFARSKLDLAERARNRPAVELHRDLLRLRRTEPAFRAQRAGGVDGAVLGAEAFVLRFFGEPRGGVDDRLLLVNLGRDLHLHSAPEPLLGPPEGYAWVTQWSSEDPRYGGGGTPPLDSADDNWHLPGHAAVVLKPGSRRFAEA